MEITGRKIFRNCPYAELNIACEQCCNYDKCMEEQRKRQIRREHDRIQKRQRMLAIILILSILLSLKFCGSAEGSKKPEEDTAETTNATSPKEEKNKTTEPAIETTIEIEETSELIQVMETEEITDVTVECTETGDVTILISAEGPGEVYVYHVTEEEKLLIAKMVYAEARGECFEGKVAVAAVLLNRWVTDDPIFAGKSIEVLIKASGQFANIEWITESHLAQVPECMQAVEAALKGWDPTRKAEENGNVLFPNGAKYFYAPATISAEQMELREGVPTLYIGNHAFHDTFNVVG